jgi:hypothetical protein
LLYEIRRDVRKTLFPDFFNGIQQFLLGRHSSSS